MPKVAVNIVTWNSQVYIEACLKALLQQTCQDFAITVVDNRSEDQSVAIIYRYAERGVRLIQNADNEGYAPAHNKAIASTDSEFVLNLNPDVILTPTYLEQMIDAVSGDAALGSVAGKLLSISPEEFQADTFASKPLTATIIDGTGLIMFRSRRQFLRDHLRAASEYGLETDRIFGPDGAAPLYRRSMLEDIKIEGEYFDALFRSHKEDVDLAWRAQLLGWDSLYTPHAVAYHVRGFRPGQRTQLSARIRRDAVKNRWLMNLKNELPALFLQDLPFIALYELRILAYLLIREQSSLPAIWDFLGLVPHMLARRRAIQQRRKRDSRYMRRWFQ